MVEFRKVFISCAEIRGLIHTAGRQDSDELVEERVVFTRDGIKTFSEGFGARVVELEIEGGEQLCEISNLIFFYKKNKKIIKKTSKYLKNKSF